jgi:hypothetical protein
VTPTGAGPPGVEGDHRRYREGVLEIPVVALDPDLPLPVYARPDDAGLDLVAD